MIKQNLENLIKELQLDLRNTKKAGLWGLVPEKVTMIVYLQNELKRLV